MEENKNGLHEGHRERLRKRFLETGLDGFDEHEVLELLLTYAIPRVDVNERAHRLIKRFGSLAAVLDAPFEELTQVEGVGERAASLLKLEPQLLRRYQLSRQVQRRDHCLDTAEKAGAYLLPRFTGLQEEAVYLLCLDPGGHLLKCILLSRGTETAALIPVKKLVETALRERAHSVVLAHNHPGGTAVPSREDVELTRRLYEALRLVDVQLADHLVVADNDFTSLAESGYFKAFENGA